MRASEGPFAPPEPDGADARAREGRRAGRLTLDVPARRGMALLAVSGLASGLAPQEPTGGQPGTATGPRTACYWCGVYLSPGTPVWVYRARTAQRRGQVAHPACHADAMGEPVGTDERGPT